jgi:3-oxoacyl-[acyl-carrier protein] reductase
VSAVLITGAAGVIGSAVLAALAGEPWLQGAGFVLPARDPGKFKTLPCWPGCAGRVLDAPRLDLGDPSQVGLFCGAALARHAPYTAVVLAAGISHDATVLKLTETEWDRVLQVDALSVHCLLTAMLEGGLLAPGAGILLVGSQVGLRGNHGQAAYAAAKGLLLDLMRAEARRTAALGCRLNLLLPPLVDSPLLAGLSPAARERLFASRLLPDPDPALSCARSAAFLLSPSAGYVHGAVWHADSRISGLPWE